jgi:hypothetical protein
MISKKENSEKYTSSLCDRSTGIFHVINLIGKYPENLGNGKTLWILESGYPSPIFLFVNGKLPEWIDKLEPYDSIFLSTRQLNSDSIPLELLKPIDAYTLMTSLGTPDKPAPCVKMEGTTATLDLSKVSSCRFPQLGTAYAMVGKSKDNLMSVEFWLPTSDGGLKDLPSYFQENATIYISPDSIDWGYSKN